MNSYLLARELGDLNAAKTFVGDYTYRLYQEMKECHQAVFNPKSTKATASTEINIKKHTNAEILSRINTYTAGAVNTLCIESGWEKRWMLSGHADSSIRIWSLNTPPQPDHVPTPSLPSWRNQEKDKEEKEEIKIFHRPVAILPRTQTHKYAITSLRFYPFDSGMFTSTSYDGHLKVWDSNLLAVAGTFDVGGINKQQIWTQAFSEVPSQCDCLVAVGGEGGVVRLVDLRSGVFTHTLISSSASPSGDGETIRGINDNDKISYRYNSASGSYCYSNDNIHSLSWHPILGHVLVVGHGDGTIKLWDVRFSTTSPFANLSSSSTVSSDSSSLKVPRSGSSNRAHSSPVIGLSFTSPGTHLLSLSSANENKLRLWDMNTGKNTLVNYGPWIRRYQTSLHVHNINPVITSQRFGDRGEICFVPSDGVDGVGEIFGFDLLTGKMVKRMKMVRRGGNIKCLIERPGYAELYSGGQDGVIRMWGATREFEKEVE